MPRAAWLADVLLPSPERRVYRSNGNRPCASFLEVEGCEPRAWVPVIGANSRSVYLVDLDDERVLATDAWTMMVRGLLTNEAG